ncbi:hypothetical protein FK545_20720 (plasmid) [Planococcus glaciei]|nr:hypothetical protein [Planococcus glaciei]QDY47007.1 hypothetical protein FK545_20720 [Planococcus glaciei]
MLLKIDSSLVDYLKDNSSKPNLINNEVQALNNLSIAHRDKKHILFGSLDVVEFLKDFKPLDDTALGIFSNLFKKFTFMGIYEEMFDNQILIKSREHKFLKKFVKEKVIFEIPITDFFRYREY